MVKTIAFAFILYKPPDSILLRLKHFTDDTKYTVYLIDNSPNHCICIQIRELASRYPNFFYFPNEENVGIAGGLLQLFSETFLSNNFGFVFFDQDTAFKSDTIAAIYSLIIEREKEIEQGLSIYFSGDDKSRLKNAEGHLKEGHFTVNSGMFFSLSVVKKTIWPKPNFFVECIDYDYCLECSILKVKIEVADKIVNLDHHSEQDYFNRIRILNKSIFMRTYSKKRVIDYIKCSFVLSRNALLAFKIKYLFRLQILLLKFIFLQIVFATIHKVTSSLNIGIGNDTPD